jgi:hypothetical protein
MANMMALLTSSSLVLSDDAPEYHRSGVMELAN